MSSQTGALDNFLLKRPLYVVLHTILLSHTLSGGDRA